MNTSDQSITSDLQLAAAIDQTIDLAAELDLTECEVITRLLERFSLKSVEHRAAASAIRMSVVGSQQKFFDGKAGP